MVEPDVVVAGGGPAGAACAVLLARAGCRVAVLERRHFPRPKACAEYLSPGAVELLQRMGLGEVAARARAVPGMDIVSAGGNRLRVDYRVNGHVLYARTLQRRVLDLEILGEAARSGAEVFEGVTVRDVILEGSKVVGLRAIRGGRDFALRAPLTLVADGARSTVARRLHLAAPPRWPVRLGLVAHFEGEAVLPDGFGQMHVRRGGYCGIAPLPDQQVNVAMVVRADALTRSRLSASTFFDQWCAEQAGVAAALQGCTRYEPVRGLLPVGARARSVGVPGALLVGDAAGFFDPFTGEGIHRALLSAHTVAPLVLQSLAGALDLQGLLRRYAADRSDAFRAKSCVTSLVQTFVQWPPLMDYALPRLQGRAEVTATLGAVLGDLVDANRFLSPPMLWNALRP